MSNPYPYYPSGVAIYPPWGSGMASGFTIQSYHISSLYDEFSGVENVIGLNPLKGFLSLTARITGVETGYFNLTTNTTSNVPEGSNLYFTNARAQSAITFSLKTLFDFGAKGDGVTDDTIAVQNALNYAASGNTTIFCPRGIYPISSQIFVTGNTSSSLGQFVGLEGVGDGVGGNTQTTTFKWIGSSNSNTSLFKIQDINKFSAKSISFYGNNTVGKIITVSPSGIGYSPFGWVFEDCIFSNVLATGNCFFIDGTTSAARFRFVGCSFTPISGNAGFYSSNPNSLDHSFIQCNFSKGQIGISIDGGSYYAYGTEFSTNTFADAKFVRFSPSVLEGCFTQNSNQFISVSNADSSSSLTLIGCNASSYPWSYWKLVGENIATQPTNDYTQWATISFDRAAGLNIVGCTFVDPFGGAFVGNITPSGSSFPSVIVPNSKSVALDVSNFGSMSITNSSTLSGTRQFLYYSGAQYPMQQGVKRLYKKYNQGGTTQTISMSDGNVQEIVLSNNTALTFDTTQAEQGDFLTLIVNEVSPGGYSPTFSSNVKLAGNVFIPTQSTGSRSLIQFVFDGTNWNETSRIFNLNSSTNDLGSLNNTFTNIYSTAISGTTISGTTGYFNSLFISGNQKPLLNLTTVNSPLFFTNNILSGSFASSTQSGFLLSSDWNTFNNKTYLTLNSGNLTSNTPAVTFAGGTNAVIGGGTSITIVNATSSQTGLLTKDDWNTFNNKTNTVVTTGSLTTVTTGVTVFNGANSIINTGVSINISIATAGQQGLLNSGDFYTFSQKQNLINSGTLSTTTPGISIVGGQNVLMGQSTTINIQQADANHSGLLASGDWTTFNNKTFLTLSSGNLTTSTPGITIAGGTNAVIGAGASVNIQSATTSQSGLLGFADWNTFNSKYSSTGGFLTGHINYPTSGIYNVGNSSFPASGVFSNSFFPNTRYITSSSTLGSTDTNIFTSQTSGIVLVINQQSIGKEYRIISTGISSVNTITISGAGTNIDGGSLRILSGNSNSSSLYLISDGTNYFTLNSGTLGTISQTQSPLFIQGSLISGQNASSSQNGFLISTDWSTFNNKQQLITTGNLTTQTPGITVANGSNILIGQNATINIQAATTTQSGLLAFSDWNTFNSKFSSSGGTLTGSISYPSSGLYGIGSQTNPASNIFTNILTAQNINPSTSGMGNVGSLSNAFSGVATNNLFGANLIISGTQSLNVGTDGIETHNAGSYIVLNGNANGIYLQSAGTTIFNVTNANVIPNVSGTKGLGTAGFPFGNIYTETLNLTSKNPTIQGYASGYNLTITSSGTNSEIIIAANGTPEVIMSGTQIITQSGISLQPQLSGYSNIGTSSVPYGSGYFNNLYSPYVAKAWCTFDGTSSAVGSAINVKSSLNISGSKVDHPATGKYGVHFAQIQNTSNYSVFLTTSGTIAAGTLYFASAIAKSTTGFDVLISSSAVAAADVDDVNVIVFGW